MPAVSELIKRVNEGLVGSVRMVSIREHRFPFLEKVDNWNRFNSNTGGTLVEKCCHFFDLMNLITGDLPVRVMASGGQDVNHLDEKYEGLTPDILDNAYVAGWFQLEHDALGFEFGTFTDRFEKLEEALQIIIPMIRGEKPSFEGKHYWVKEAINEPPPVRKIPIMIGGSGEKKTLRMVAQYADESNLVCMPDEIPRKLEVLDEHCSNLGRDRSEISVSWLGTLGIAPSQEEAEKARNEFFAARGIDWDSLDEEFQKALTARIIMGGPDEVREQVQSLIDMGLDGLTVNMPASGHDPEMVALAGETLSPLFNN